MIRKCNWIIRFKKQNNLLICKIIKYPLSTTPFLIKSKGVIDFYNHDDDD